MDDQSHQEHEKLLQNLANDLRAQPDACFIIAVGLQTDGGVSVRTQCRLPNSLVAIEALCAVILGRINAGFNRERQAWKDLDGQDRATLRRLHRALTCLRDPSRDQGLITPEQERATYATGISHHLHPDGHCHIELRDDDLTITGNILLPPDTAKAVASEILTNYEMASHADPIGVPEGRA